MDFQIFTGNPAELPADTLVVTINDNGELSASAEKIDSASGGAIQARISAKDVTGSAGSSLTLYSLANTQANRTVIAGSGKENLNAVDANKIASTIGKAIAGKTGTAAVDVLSLIHI